MAEDILLPARGLFRFEIPCWKLATGWTAKGIELGPAHRLPQLAALEGDREFADVRIAWNGQGLYFTCQVTGKAKTPWCRATRASDSDGLHVWIDTRNTHNIHRASRFCHAFALLPSGGGAKQADPFAGLVMINRARDNPRHVAPDAVQIRGSLGAGGYEVRAFIPAAALTGFDPDEHPKLGFTYAVRDSELGEQTFCAPASLPYAEDPSLWCTLELAMGH